jgi:hypothetical protein
MEFIGLFIFTLTPDGTIVTSLLTPLELSTNINQAIKRRMFDLVESEFELATT